MEECEALAAGGAANIAASPFAWDRLSTARPAHGIHFSPSPEHFLRDTSGRFQWVSVGFSDKNG